MARRAVVILLSVLVLWNLACGIVWLEVAVAIPLNRASNEHGQIEDVERRLESMQEAQAAYREQAFDFLFNLVVIALAVNILSLISAIGLILSRSTGWPAATKREAVKSSNAISATTPSKSNDW